MYKITLKTKWGDPIAKSSSQMLTADGQSEYQFILTPDISDIDNHSGGENGNLLKITGSAFGSKKENVSVSAGGLDCEIQEISNTEITCKVSPGSTDTPTAQGQFLKGQGA